MAGVVSWPDGSAQNSTCFQAYKLDFLPWDSQGWQREQTSHKFVLCSSCGWGHQVFVTETEHRELHSIPHMNWNVSVVLIFLFYCYSLQNKKLWSDEDNREWLEEVCGNNLPPLLSFASAHAWDFHMHEKGQKSITNGRKLSCINFRAFDSDSAIFKSGASGMFKEGKKSYFAYLFHILEEYIPLHYPRRFCSEPHQFV